MSEEPFDLFKIKYFANPELIQKNVMLDDRRTTLRLESIIWDAIDQICEWEGCTLNEILTEVSQRKAATATLASSVRVFVLCYFRTVKVGPPDN